MDHNLYEPPGAERPPAAEPVRMVGATGGLSIDRALREAWPATKRNLAVLAGAALIYVLASVALALAEAKYGFVAQLALLVVAPPFAWGVARVSLDALDGRARFASLFSAFERPEYVLPRMFVLFVLQKLVALPGAVVVYYGRATDAPMIVVAGMFVSLLWTVVVGVRLRFSTYGVVERGLSPLEAIAQSWRTTGTVWGPIVALELLALVIGLLGLPILLVGVIVSLPFSHLLFTSAYRQLHGRPADDASVDGLRPEVLGGSRPPANSEGT
ncbi:MAG: hypothetical protein R3F34_13930 [Planctomycetota bacterium]